MRAAAPISCSTAPTSGSVMPRPVKRAAMPPASFALFWSTSRESLSHSLCMMSENHMSNSSSTNLTSSAGSCVPGGTGWPCMSVLPAASTTCIRTSACRASSRKRLPRPLPLWAPGTSPATSMSFTGMRRVPSRHMSCVCRMPKCLQGHLVRTYATPTLGDMVVNGKLPVCTVPSVAAAKKVDLPTLALPSSPTCMCGGPGAADLLLSGAGGLYSQIRRGLGRSFPSDTPIMLQ